MQIRLLGPVRIAAGDAVAEVGPAQRCLVLAALAADAGRLVSREVLIDRVWGQSPPGGAWRTLQTHIAHIRGALTRAGAPGHAVRVHRGGGYLLDVNPDVVDVHRLRRLATGAAAGSATADGTAAERLLRWREAVGLWRGEPLIGLGGEWVERARQAWWDQCRDAVLGWTSAEIEAGDPALVLDWLGDLIVRYPLVEALPAALMRALYAAGRRTEALGCYAAARDRLDEELAERPGPELQAVYQAILRRETDLPQPARAHAAGAAAPAQLPADVRGFAGRGDQLAALDAIAATVGEEATTVITAIAGTAGVGKTALAVHWAHRAAARFPDGQLYVNLRGFDPAEAVRDPADVIRSFLDALAIPTERIPDDRDAQAALYRTLLADKRMLVVLDNARDSEQVRPLLPGAPGCLVLVTSRNRLTSLVTVTGAHPVPLDLLTPAEARDLLTRRLGQSRVLAEPDAVNTITARSARLPLALALVAARAATNPHLTLTDLAAGLADADTSLDALADEDPATDLRAVFSWSYATLTPAARRLFRLLGLHPGPDIAIRAAASLAARTTEQVRPLLAELTTANLLAGHSRGRYTFHDLLRAYAAHLAHTTDTADQRRAATRRVLDHYLHTAYRANRLLCPTRIPITLAPAEPGVTPERPATYGEALAWFTTEHEVLVAAVNHASAAGLDTRAWHLAWAMADYLYIRAHWRDLVAVDRLGVAAAERLADPAAQALTHRLLGRSYIQVSRYDDADLHLRRALSRYHQIDDQTGEAFTHQFRALVSERRDQPIDGLGHIRQALRLFTATDHQPGLAYALTIAGLLHSRAGDHRQALTHCRQAIALHDELGNGGGLARTWEALGDVHRQLGDLTQATACYRTAIDLYRDLGCRRYQADALILLGDTQHTAGDHAAARTAWRQALAVLEHLDHPDADHVRTKLRR